MFYAFIRNLTCPFEKIEEFVPKKGKILDVGCGHGLFSKLMAEKSGDRQILGIDPSVKKIKAAEKGNKLDNLSFKATYLEKINEKFDCISIVDMLYLLPDDQKLKLLENCRKLLNKDGRLILVENGFGKEFIFSILKLQESIMTKILKFTYSDFRGLYFLDSNNYRKLLIEAGFRVITEKNLKSVIPYPHVMFVVKVE